MRRSQTSAQTLLLLAGSSWWKQNNVYRLLLVIVLAMIAGIPAGCQLSPDVQQAQPRVETAQPRVEIPPTKILTAFDTAVNNHNTEAIIALFADDAVVTVRPDYVYQGRDEIRDWLHAIQLNRLHIEGRAVQENGDTISRIVRHTWEKSRSIESFQNEVVIREGQIISYTLEIRPPQANPTPTPGPDQPNVEP